MKSNKKVLELRDVVKSYQLDDVTVLAIRGVSLTVAQGEFVSIMGMSGSGKSSLLNLIGALDLPTSGSIFLDETEINHLTESELARLRGKKIGFVFQTFNLYPALNVFENVALPMRIHEFEEEKIQKQVTELIRRVGLAHRVEHLPAQLSGGERQRVAIARALSAEPEIILADEPTGNLDTKTSGEIMHLFAELHEEEGKTIVLVTHEPDIAAYAQRMIELRDGKIIRDEKNLKRRKR